METVIKIGGSLGRNTASLKKLCLEVGRICEEHGLVVVPGGGKFADVVREFYRNFSLSEETADKMAILAMDQFGLLLCDLIPNSLKVKDLKQVKFAVRKGKTPVFIPSNFLFKHNPLEHSWNVTSDSISAYLAGLLGAKRLLLLKDVDGIFTADPHKERNAKLIPKITASKLSQIKNTCLDNYFSSLLLKFNLECYVLNGFHPKRIWNVLERKKTLCTFIEAK